MTKKKSGKGSKIAEALGASRVIRLTDKKTGDPLAWLRLAHDVQTRLISRGGRPSDPKWNTKRLVPFRREIWKHLSQEAKVISAHGRKVGPAQLAAIMIEESLAPTSVIAASQETLIQLAASPFEVRQAFDNSGTKPRMQPLVLSSTPVFRETVEPAPAPELSAEAPPQVMWSASIGV